VFNLTDTVTKRIAAAEVLKVRRTEEKLYMVAAIIPLVVFGLNMLSPEIVPVIAVGSAGLFGYFYMKAKAEVERLGKEYDL